ncbi:hypothetical protein ITP53_43930 [Nonomuraea sp. K274]|uniref:Secreted protein n=1 Tax=Nonomuraea cypriaca TaxID=1187855 RepID=A0A931F4C2_9ACTN|nr:hypothetical protein [Nonomuraea cypriaca]MBF8192517.1 hypothetical protein [Nonomuraea cypriaca]
MGSRTAISVGVLAVALVAVPMAAPAAASATTNDCTRDGGLLSGVTNTLCDVVNAVTGTVGTLTGGTTDKVTEPLEKTTDEVLGRVGEAVPTGKPRRTSEPPERDDPAEPSPKPARTTVLPEPLEDVCLPVLACDEEGMLDVLTPGPPIPTPSPERTRPSKKRPDDDSAAVPTLPPTPPESRPQQLGTGRPVIEERKARSDTPRVDLLWPNPFAHELSVPMQDQRVVRPSPPASDVLGTVLTIALLGSAVLATRIVQQRRQRTEPAESIPFEPARAGNGRHRLA